MVNIRHNIKSRIEVKLTLEKMKTLGARHVRLL